MSMSRLFFAHFSVLSVVPEKVIVKGTIFLVYFFCLTPKGIIVLFYYSHKIPSSFQHRLGRAWRARGIQHKFFIPENREWV